MLFFSYLCKVIKTYSMIVDVSTAFVLLGIVLGILFLVGIANKINIMTIKKVKKVKNLKPGDIILVDVADQNDAGVFSDRTGTNVLVIVDSIEFKKDNASILANGGYEFTYPKDLITFYLGNYSNIKEEADALYEAFNKTEVSVKDINGYIREAEEFIKSMKFIKNHSN